MRTSRIALIIPVLFWSANCLAANPNATANYLMHKPVSMLDLGIMRMNMQLQQFPGLHNDTVEARYDRNAKRIVIHVSDSSLESVGPSGATSMEDMAATRCYHLFYSVRMDLGVGLTGSTYLSGHSIAADLFLGASETPKNQPKHLLRNIDRLIEIKARVHYRNERPPVVCWGPLVGGGVHINAQ